MICRYALSPEDRSLTFRPPLEGTIVSTTQNASDGKSRAKAPRTANSGACISVNRPIMTKPEAVGRSGHGKECSKIVVVEQRSSVEWELRHDKPWTHRK
jgi:hypothetical protein